MTHHRRLQIWTGKERRRCQRFIRDQHSQGIYGITVPELRRYRETTRKDLVQLARSETLAKRQWSDMVKEWAVAT